MKHTTYSTQATQDVADFLKSASVDTTSGSDTGAFLDSVRTETPSLSRIKIPAQLDALLGKVTRADEGRFVKTILDGVGLFAAENGTAPTADVVEAAIQQGLSAFYGCDHNGRVLLDSASSAHHDPMSLQPNRAITAMMSAIAEAIPFASYLPVDIASNQAKLIIGSHQAGSTYGDYVSGGLMDGISAGGTFTSSSRMVRFDHSGVQPYNSKFAQTNLALDPGYCDPAGTGVPVLRGRTVLYVNGVPAGTDLGSGGAANSPLNASAVVGGVTYSIAGYVTVANGAIQLTTVTPDFAAGMEVTAESFVDYEVAPALIPSVNLRVDGYDIFANPWRVKTGISIDASTQIRNEAGWDGTAESLNAIRTQMVTERHRRALSFAWNLGANNSITFDYGYSTQIAQKSRAQIWEGFRPVLANLDQKMANDTMDHGITHLYVPAFIAGDITNCADFVPSGITARPGIYRVGRLFGKYEVYYSPYIVSQASNLSTATILAIGRSTQVARCPVVLGDAVAPTYLPLARGSDLIDQSAMYARDFTVVNPHAPSALGCARISITNLA